jgi:membrane-associated phospholipid phosphatase
MLPRVSLYGRAVGAGFRSHMPLYVLLAVLYASAISASGATGVSLLLMDMLAPVQLAGALTALIIAGSLAGKLIAFMRSGSPGSPLMALRRHLAERFLAPEPAARLLHGLAFVTLFFPPFLYIKRIIPEIAPFTWDETFSRLDGVLHFSTQPYEWLLPLLGGVPTVFTVAVLYNLWFLVLMGFWFWQIFRRDDDHQRLRCLLALGLTWFIGTDVLGIVFSSAGPCFYGRLLPGADPYAPLMAHLSEVNAILPVLSLPVQDQLWNAYQSLDGTIAGISAMPSVHVASAVLFVFFGYGIARWLGWLMVCFASAIFLGSIVLGWHYAIDGYAGAALAVVMWYAADALVRRIPQFAIARPAYT